MINSFKGEYEFLSNFYPSPIVYRGIPFPTVEHAFQAAKTNQPDEVIWIAEAATPGIAKRRGRKVTLRSDWEEIKLEKMYALISLKFDDPALYAALCATEPHTLVEGNYWHDQFWGDCSCASHADVAGRNYLGKILMYVRQHRW